MKIFVLCLLFALTGCDGGLFGPDVDETMAIEVEALALWKRPC